MSEETRELLEKIKESSNGPEHAERRVSRGCFRVWDAQLKSQIRGLSLTVIFCLIKKYMTDPSIRQHG